MKIEGQFTDFVLKMKAWAKELGFSDLRIADIRLDEAEKRLEQWLAQGFHGEMHYMAAHGMKRCRPDELLPGTVRVVSVRMDYLPDTKALSQAKAGAHRADPLAARISLYARGRDYHKVLRSRLQKLADKMQDAVGPFAYRVFADSAPVMEVAFAGKAGMGWQGKNNLLLCRDGGSFFFLGEMLVDLPLPVDSGEETHCGTCTRCIQACPTGALVAPYRLDARRCISYLTIEFKGSIPMALRPSIGNRIYGCDDCQLCCPWNRFAKASGVSDFAVRHDLDRVTLLELFGWTETEFLQRMQGSPVRRIGYACWCRNIAVALGNALRAVNDTTEMARIVAALRDKRQTVSDMVDEHIDWALAQKP